MDATRHRLGHPQESSGVRVAQTLTLMGALVLVSGCGPRSPEGETAAETASGGETQAHTETRESALDTRSPASCDPALVSLVGRFTLTHYPGQDDVGPNGERPLGMSKEYAFTRDAYTMEGYPPLRITGRYEVLERDGLRQRVRFYDTVFDGRPDEDRELWLVFEDCGDTLQMDGMTYTRQEDAP